MRGEDDRRAFRHLIQLFDEYRAHALEALDHEAIVDDFMTHIDRRAVLLQCNFDDLDRAIDAGTEASRSRQQDRQLLL